MSRAALGVAISGPLHAELGGRAVICDHLIDRYVIYGLVDPKDPLRVRYVGRARNPYARYKEHLTGSATTSSVVAAWVEGVCVEARMPAMVLLEACAIGDEERAEYAWIEQLRAIDQADLNRVISTLRYRLGA